MEVELKARVADPAAVEGALGAFARFERAFDKEDLYFARPRSRAEGLVFDLLDAAEGGAAGSAPGRNPAADLARDEDRGRAFRLRRDGDKAFVTYKNKTRQGGVEVNLEREFEVSDPSLMRELAERLGCVVVVDKRKRGRAYRAGDCLIELCEVAGLGWFCEIEIIVPEGLAPAAEAAAIALAKEELRATLAKCGLGEADIEGRYYTEMLAELRGAGADGDGGVCRGPGRQ